MKAETFPDQPSLEPFLDPSAAPSETASFIFSVVSLSSLKPLVFQSLSVVTKVDNIPIFILSSLAFALSSFALAFASRCSLAELPSTESSSPIAVLIFLEAFSLRFSAFSSLRFSDFNSSSRIDSIFLRSSELISLPYFSISLLNPSLIEEILDLIELIDEDAVSLSNSDLIKPLRARFCFPLRNLTDLLASSIISICLEAL